MTAVTSLRYQTVYCSDIRVQEQMEEDLMYFAGMKELLASNEG